MIVKKVYKNKNCNLDCEAQCLCNLTVGKHFVVNRMLSLPENFLLVPIRKNLADDGLCGPYILIRKMGTLNGNSFSFFNIRK